MSTRTRARVTRTRRKQEENSTIKQEMNNDDDVPMDSNEKENDIVGEAISPGALQTKPVSKNGVPSKTPKRGRKKASKREVSLSPLDCICARGDDGSPMILCAECQTWYHFTCVDITEPEAEDIRVFVCSSCSEATGRRTTREWEGEEAYEESLEDPAVVTGRRKVALKSQKQRNGVSPHDDVKVVSKLGEESEGLDDSEDEYVDEEKEGKSRSGRKRLTRLRRGSTATAGDNSDLEEENSGTVSKRRRLSRSKPSPSPSPAPSHRLKRKATNTPVGRGTSPPPSKRKRSGSQATTSAETDPARKYCLGKMEDIFKGVFLKYPHVRVTKEENGVQTTEVVLKKTEDLSDEEKEAALEESREFARELENCVFEMYAEPDKHNDPHAGPKYKDRFRTLQFNLSKPDRVVIHQRITAGTLSAKEISTMSSTDLADEETKQHIKLAEKEALEHSILQKQTAPRAKITHKGLQDIEDVRGDMLSARELEVQKEREQQEEERRERERLARLRTNNAPRQRTASLSVPPESPTTQHQSPSAALLGAQQGEDTWGAPPPVPLHAMSPTVSERPPLFIHSSSDFIVPNVPLPEPELNLTDLINIDEEQDAGINTTTNTATDGTINQPLVGPNFVSSPTESSTPLSATGVSPFAQRQDRPRTASFDLNALWTQGRKDDSAEGPPASVSKEELVPAETAVEAPRSDSDKDDNMELESVEANDQDFDMLLAEEPSPVEADIVTPPVPKSVEELEKVWSGKIVMPLDSAVDREASLVARQIGGKELSDNSPLWKTLFPADMLRVDGRVAVESAIKYLLQMRLNPAKELYAVAFAPASSENEADFKAFNSFLRSKNRHGLVFPWGHQPKEYHPGKELYIIPLLQDDPLPEFVELLVDLKMPKTRSIDYLLGVWVLNKGKLAPLPGHLSQPVPTPAQAPPPVLPSISPPVPFGVVPSVPTMSPLGGPMSGIPSGAISAVPDASTLAAEVASLTPEQIQSVLRSLASTTQAVSSLPPGPPIIPGQIPPPNHTWMPPPGMSPTTYAPNFPPSHSPYQQGTPPSQYDHPDHLDYDRHARGGYDRDYGGGYDDRGRGRRGDDRGERGWRGQGGRGGRGGRGRGRGRGGGREDHDDRHRDTGWPRRSKNEIHGGPPW